MTNPVGWWGRVLAFDALIGNTDRHPENWGFLLGGGAGSRPRARALAPAFDNGASLGYELREMDIGPLMIQGRLVTYLEKGRHHCSWERADDRRAGHIELCRRYLAAYPNARSAMKSVVDFDMMKLTRIIEECTSCRVDLPFSAERADFVVELIAARRASLQAAFGD